jgi:hypothetical protein
MYIFHIITYRNGMRYACVFWVLLLSNSVISQVPMVTVTTDAAQPETLATEAGVSYRMLIVKSFLGNTV